MICTSCRKQNHGDCRGGTWCDCQHVTDGVNINPTYVSVTHMSPGDDVVTPCCGKTPYELSRTERVTEDPEKVTCLTGR